MRLLIRTEIEIEAEEVEEFESVEELEQLLEAWEYDSSTDQFPPLDIDYWDDASITHNTYTILDNEGEPLSLERAFALIGRPPEDTETLHMFDSDGNVIVKY